MLNFILAENYRMLRNKALRWVLVTAVLMLLLSAIQMRYLTPYPNDLATYMIVVEGMLSFGLYVLAAVTTTAYPKDRATLLQLLAQGHTKGRILIGQFLSSMISGFITIVFLLPWAILFGILFFQPVDLTYGAFALEMIQAALVAILIMIPLNAICLSLQYILMNPLISLPAFFGLTFVFPAIFDTARTMNRAINFFLVLSPYDMMYQIVSKQYFWVPMFWGILINTVLWLAFAGWRFRKHEF